MKFYKGVVYFLAAICLITGAGDIIQGLANLGSFGSNLPPEVYTDPVADNIFRFFAAIWFGTGVLLIIFAQDLERYKAPMLALLGIIILGGFARIISIVQYGYPTDSTGATMVAVGLIAELIVVPVLMISLIKMQFSNN